MPTVEFRDDSAALEYIRKRGYASYSSIKNVRDCAEPTVVDAKYFVFGKELHSRFLENRKLETLSKEEERMLADMLMVLRGNSVVKNLMNGAKTEQKFHQLLYGVMVLGYIDAENYAISDLKTTRLNDMRRFVDSMDFLQAAMYLAVRKKKDFFYIGISKQAPYKLMVFNVNQYPVKLEAAKDELKKLLAYIKKKL